MIDPTFDGPIPGENFTSDTKNYPWHRPPDFSEVDPAIEYAIDVLSDEDVGLNYMAMIDAGMTIATATDIFVTLGMARGKWTPDMALLIAGPISRVFEIFAKTHEIKYELGLTSKSKPLTAAFLRSLMEDEDLDAAPSEALQGDLEGEGMATPSDMVSELPMDGLGAPASKDEQMAMLGQGPEEAPMEELPLETDQEMQ